MKSTSLRAFRRHENALVASSALPVIGLVTGIVLGVTALVACGSSTTSDDSRKSTGGAGGADAGAGPRSISAGGASGAPATSGACNAKPPKVLATTGTQAQHLFASGTDLYFIEVPDGANTMSIMHVKDDGSGAGMVYTSPDYGYGILSLWVTSDTIFFVESNQQGQAALYRMPRSGGDKVKLSKDYGQDIADIGGVDANAVYIAVPTDTGNDLRRIPMSGGSETVVATVKGLALKDMQVVGSDMWFLANDGLDGYYKVSLSMAGASPTQVSMEPCALEAAVTSAGVYCSDALALNRMPLTGGPYAKVLDLPGGPVDVSMPDGDFIYLVPKSTPDAPGTLRKFPVAGGMPADVSCNRGTMTVPVFDDNGVYWFEEDPKDMQTKVYGQSKR